MERNSVNLQTKDRYLDMSEPALLNDNHYHTDTEVSLVSLQTEGKPSKRGGFGHRPCRMSAMGMTVGHCRLDGYYIQH